MKIEKLKYKRKVFRIKYLNLSSERGNNNITIYWLSEEYLGWMRKKKKDRMKENKCNIE